MHQRQVIRGKVVDLLSAGVPLADTRVFPMRFVEYVRGDLPAIGVYVTKETADVDGGLSLREDILRNMTLSIEGTVSVTENVENDMDALAEQIELAMDADRTFGGEAADSDHTDTEIGISTMGEMPVGLITLTYRVTYTVRPSA